MKTTERASSAQRCPYCHDDVARTMQAVACTRCGSVHHRECFDERGACSIFACTSERTHEVAIAGSVLRAWRESHERARGYKRSAPFSALLLLLCLVAAGGIGVALATDALIGLAFAPSLILLLPLLYVTTRLLAFGACGLDAATHSSSSRRGPIAIE